MEIHDRWHVVFSCCKLLYRYFPARRLEIPVLCCSIKRFNVGCLSSDVSLSRSRRSCCFRRARRECPVTLLTTENDSTIFTEKL
jgi:hypothetical protein